MNKNKEEQKLLDIIFESAIEGILLTDDRGFIIRSNPAASKIFGYNSGELINQNTEILIPEGLSSKDKLNFANDHHIPQGRPIRHFKDSFGKKKDGIEFPLEVSFSLASIGKKNVTIIFIKDKTEEEKTGKDLITSELIKNEQKLRNDVIELENKIQKRTEELTLTIRKLLETNVKLENQVKFTQLAEAEVRKRNAFYLTIAKHFPMGMIIVTDRDYKITFIDGNELEKLGMDSVSLKGGSVDAIEAFDSERKERIKQNIDRIFEGQNISIETEFQDESYSVSSMPLYNEKNQVERALVVFYNIGKQKKAEQAVLKALNKEKELNELKSRFISLASHEFRTPLSTILSSANLISRQNEPRKQKEIEKNVQRIKSNVNDLVVILNDFLSLGKIEEGKVILQPSSFDIIALLNTLIQEVEINKRNGQNIKLIAQDPLISVCLDKNVLRNIILNLLSNAFKYSPENKEIIVKITTVSDRVLLQIIDQGIGIPKEEISNLFERFFRAKNATNIQGTGLGLNIVKKYVELMDGTISVISELNKGTSFLVTLPLKTENYEKNITY